MIDVAVVGATGLVGTAMLRQLEASALPIGRLWPVASAQSVGRTVAFKGQPVAVVDVDQALAARPQFALFSAGGAASLELAPRFAAAGATVVDNSSAWRMDDSVPLVVPEVNPQAVGPGHRIVANPNCSTIQMVVALQPLHRALGLRRIIVSTYQSVSGSGQKGVAQLEAEEQGLLPAQPAYPYGIHRNLMPQIDAFADQGYTKEELKMMRETRKIMGLPGLRVAATTVRVPVHTGHAESIYAEFERPVNLEAVRTLLRNAPGVVLQDDPARQLYPMPMTAAGHADVFVGRLRPDPDDAHGLHLWVVADNLLKGAAANAVQIVEMLAARG